MNDYISRQEAIDGIMHFMPDELEANASAVEGVNYSAWVCALICAKTFVRTMPSAQPERKKGKWLDKEIIDDRKDAKIQQWQQARCSVCDKWHTTPFMYYFENYDFCPNCGADMRGDNKE